MERLRPTEMLLMWYIAPALVWQLKVVAERSHSVMAHSIWFVGSP
jgi:hypothetical protein